VLVSLDGKAIGSAGVEEGRESSPTLRFEKSSGRLTGSGGVNRFFGFKSHDGQ